MEKEQVVLDEKILESITNHAAKVAIDVYEKQKKQAEKEKFDKRLNNTRMLLAHYREFSNYNQKAIYKLHEKLDEDIFDIIEMMEGRRSDNDSKIESIENGVIRTRAMLKHINTMLKVYKANCNDSPYSEEKRKYRIIEALYLKKEQTSIQEIAEREGIAERTVYKDVTAACRKLTALIFGIDGFRK